MSEEKKATAPAKDTAAPKKKEKATEQNSREVIKKAKWTLQRCRKIARRFTSVKQWEFGGPSSFKSAQAHGWVAEIENQVWKNPQPVKHKKAA